MKKKLVLIIFMFCCFGLTSNAFAANIQGCQTVLPNVMIDEKIVNTTHTIILIIQIAVPVLLVIFGMLDLVKGIIAQKEDEIKKGQQIFFKRLISAAVVFFVVVIVKLLISLVSNNSEGFVSCVDCFLNGAKSCEKTNEPEQPVKPGDNTSQYIDGVEYVSGGYNNNIYYYNQNDYQDYYLSIDPINIPSISKTNYCNLGKGDCYQSIRSSGCGPTSLAMAISTLLQEEHDPVEVTAKLCANDGCPNGTKASAFSDTVQEYNLNARKTEDIQEIVNEVATKGSIVIAHATKGDFTGGTHFITITGVSNEGKFYIMDSNKEKNNHWWDASTIIDQTDWYYIISK